MHERHYTTLILDIFPYTCWIIKTKKRELIKTRVCKYAEMLKLN